MAPSHIPLIQELGAGDSDGVPGEAELQRHHHVHRREQEGDDSEDDPAPELGVERCRKLILLSISRNFGKKLRYYQQQLLQFQQPKIELQSCTLSFLQSCFCSFCRYNFGNFFSDAESADISALDADDFTDVTLAKVTLLM